MLALSPEALNELGLGPGEVAQMVADIYVAEPGDGEPEAA